MDNDEIVHVLGKIEGKLDGFTTLLGGFTALMIEHTKNDTAQLSEINEKLFRLSSRQSWMVGIGTGVVAVFSSVIAFFKV